MGRSWDEPQDRKTARPQDRKTARPQDRKTTTLHNLHNVNNNYFALIIQKLNLDNFKPLWIMAS